MSNTNTNRAELPFARYMNSLPESERVALSHQLAREVQVDPSTIWRYINGKVRPVGLKRDKIVEIIRRRDDCSTITAEVLFPESFYQNEQQA